LFHCGKKDIRIIARAVVDEWIQAQYLEEETYSPTVRLESMMLSCLIDAYEKGHVRTVDIKGAFIKAKVPDEMNLIVKLDRELSEVMQELSLELKIGEDRVMYLKCAKALHGHMEAARLFYCDLNTSLTMKMNFVRNRYDPCIYNKEAYKKEPVTVWTHVDDLKLSAKSETC